MLPAAVEHTNHDGFHLDTTWLGLLGDENPANLSSTVLTAVPARFFLCSVFIALRFLCLCYASRSLRVQVVGVGGRVLERCL